MVLLGFEDGMGDPQPRVMLPQLGDQVVRHQAHRRRQSVQHDGHEGLKTESRFHDRSSEVSSRGRGGGEEKQHIVKGGTHLQREKHGAGGDGEGEDVGNRADDDVRQQDLLLQ